MTHDPSRRAGSDPLAALRGRSPAGRPGRACPGCSTRASRHAHGQAKCHRPDTEERIDPRALMRRVTRRGISHEPTVPACRRKPRPASNGPTTTAAARARLTEDLPAWASPRPATAGPGTSRRRPRRTRWAASAPVTPAGILAFSFCAPGMGGWRHVHNLLAPSVSAGTSGAGGDARLEQLRRHYPRWLIWRGRFTGEYWAMPPRRHLTQRELISARDLDELAWRLAQAEEQHDL